MIIYCATNTVNGKKYIGMTSQSIEKRKISHKAAAIKHHKTAFQRAIVKYGFGIFVWEILETCDDHKSMCQKEIFWINKLKTKTPNGYNMTDGGEGITGIELTVEQRKRRSLNNLGRKFSDETRRRMSAAKIGRIVTQAERDNLSKKFKNKTFSDETRQKISESLKGHPVGEKTRMAVSKAQKGKIYTKEERQQMSERSKGRKHSSETKAMMSEKAKGVEKSEAHKQAMRDGWEKRRQRLKMEKSTDD